MASPTDDRTAPSPDQRTGRVAGLLTLATGRRFKWLVLILWLAIGAVAGPLSSKFDKGQKNEQSSFLPGSAESVRALNETKRFRSGDNAPAVIVYRATTRLSAPDLAKINGDRALLNAKPPPITGSFAGPIVSADRHTALLVAPLTPHGQSDQLVIAVDDMRARASQGLPAGLQAKVTGPAGFSRDAIRVFQGINGTLLLASGLLVFVLLIIIYRSPVFSPR